MCAAGPERVSVRVAWLPCGCDAEGCPPVLLTPTWGSVHGVIHLTCKEASEFYRETHSTECPRIWLSLCDVTCDVLEEGPVAGLDLSRL